MCVVGEDVIRNYSSLLFKIVETIARRGAQAAELSRVNVSLETAHKALELRFRDIARAMSDWVWKVDADAGIPTALKRWMMFLATLPRR